LKKSIANRGDNLLLVMAYYMLIVLEKIPTATHNLSYNLDLRVDYADLGALIIALPYVHGYLPIFIYSSPGARA